MRYNKEHVEWKSKTPELLTLIIQILADILCYILLNF